MDVSVCVISQPTAGMPTLIYNIAQQYSLYKPALLNHMLYIDNLSFLGTAHTETIQNSTETRVRVLYSDGLVNSRDRSLH
jgi:hypothetical protein